VLCSILDEVSVASLSITTTLSTKPWYEISDKENLFSAVATLPIFGA
jgi:hypothetical protein